MGKNNNIAITHQTIKELKYGSEDAFCLIYEAYASKIYYLALKYTKNSSDSEDIVQDIFVKILRNIDSYETQKASFGTWVYQITSNHLKNFCRDTSHHRRILATDNEKVDAYDNNFSTDLNIMLYDIERLVGENTYQILLMKLGYNMKFSEIAEEMQMNISSLKSIYYQALRIIKAYIKKEEKI